MDLSKVKWVFIGLIVIGGIWLVTEGGINWAYKSATSDEVGVDEKKDVRNEALLSKYGGFLMSTFRYEKAKQFYETAVNRYPAGAGRYWNRYQLARAEEKLGNLEETIGLLYYLWEVDADQYDERIPDQATLRLRIEKMAEVNDLPNPFNRR